MAIVVERSQYRSLLQLSSIAVMDILRSRFYTVNAMNSGLVGMWPFTESSSLRHCKLAGCFLTILSITFAVGTKLIELWGDFDAMIECLVMHGVQLGGYIKWGSYVAHRKQIKTLLETVRSDWMSLTDKKEIDIISKYAENGRYLAISYTVYMYVSCAIFVSSPLWPHFLDLIIPLNESRPPAPPIVPAEYFVDRDQHFKAILLHTYWCFFVVMAIIISMDTLFVCLVLHVCGILEVIGYRLENLISKDADVDMSKDEDLDCSRKIKICIEMHFKLTKSVELIEATYSLGFLMILGFSVMLMSITGVQMLTRLETTFAEMFRIFAFNIAQIIHLLYNTWPCQKLSDECEKLQESLYNTKWYSMSQKNKRLLMFTMMRTLKPQPITAGKLYIMSMENFGAIIKTSVSYFTVFASLR